MAPRSSTDEKEFGGSVEAPDFQFLSGAAGKPGLTLRKQRGTLGRAARLTTPAHRAIAAIFDVLCRGGSAEGEGQF